MPEVDPNALAKLHIYERQLSRPRESRGDCRLGDTFGTLNYFRF